MVTSHFGGQIFQISNQHGHVFLPRIRCYGEENGDGLDHHESRAQAILSNVFGAGPRSSWQGVLEDFSGCCAGEHAADADFQQPGPFPYQGFNMAD